MQGYRIPIIFPNAYTVGINHIQDGTIVPIMPAICKSVVKRREKHLPADICSFGEVMLILSHRKCNYLVINKYPV